MKVLGILLLGLTGCSNVSLPDNQYQAEVTKTFAQYNSAHSLNIPTPRVYIGATPGPFAGSTWCPSNNGTYLRCAITLNPSRSSNLEQTLIHEEAHVICALSVSGCRPIDHETEWKNIALELGLEKNDSYVAN